MRVPKAGVDIGTEKRSPGVFVVLAVRTENGRKTRHERDGEFLSPPAREIWSEESALESGPPAIQLATHWPIGRKWGAFSANDLRLNLTKETKSNEHE